MNSPTRYHFSTQEMLQNAEDAGATELKILHVDRVEPPSDMAQNTKKSKRYWKYFQVLFLFNCNQPSRIRCLNLRLC